MVRALFLVFAVVCLFLRTTEAFGQQKFTVSGIVKDNTTGETLIGANVKLQQLDQMGTSTNAYGFYSITAPPGKYALQVSSVGYQSFTRVIELAKNLQIQVTLSAANDLEEVVITGGNKKDQNISNPQMGLEKLNMAQINNVPVLFGERDVIKTIQLMPGVKSGGEGNTGFYVRGGASDQNLILLDEAIVYNASHLFGFFSTFNSDAIKDVTLYKGGMPAQYGGRLSSALDISMLDGNSKAFGVQGGIGLIASRLKVEGPLVNGKGSFMLSGRRTYADAFLKLSSDTSLKNASLYFYDVNAKANYHFDDRNAIYFSGYLGKDVLGLRNLFGTDWGNKTGTLRFNHIFSDKLFSNTSVIYSDYKFAAQSFSRGNEFKVVSSIRDFNVKEDLQYYISNSHTVRFGVNGISHRITPGEVTAAANSSFNAKTLPERQGLEGAAYVSDDWRIGSKLNILYGLRLSLFNLNGPGTFNTYDDTGNILTATDYNSGDLVQQYLTLEPRLSLSYTINPANSIKAAYSRNTQNIHLLSNSNASSPSDLYVMSSNNIKPEIADQVSAGYFRNFKDNTYEFSAEVYYKWLQNQIDYKNGAQIQANENVESQLVYGDGRAYGLELFVKKRTGRFNGWVGYTLSKTERRFDAINNGNYFPARQDRTHDVSLVGIYQLTKRWNLSASFIYGTGNAVTYPAGKYQLNGVTRFYYDSRNSSRMPPTHRLDLGATLEGKMHKRFHSSWTFGLYNAYNHKNPYVINFQNRKDDPTRTEAVQTSLFGVIPSVTYNFKF
ncbi:TonB-dependent receptor [Pedobacter duraquae]|uniref:TonB-dependent receptor-like protein n=1 Tax=Pedobacter duraquae TaxID=425511 RepID=A0A4R6IM74_9SPHI|nr:TonB-dependent receptor-like protein [Pedobacter duraquae]